MATGKVYLVGAGPGDAGLLTMRGKFCLEHADAIVYDHLVSIQLLNFSRADAELFDVGKKEGKHICSQRDIEDLLVALARRGLFVVRLKGGDPFVFGRGGEEAFALTEAGIDWEVVPGISSAIAVPAYAGIPVTLRNVSPAFTVITGHSSANNVEYRFKEVAKMPGTLVIMMGVGSIEAIVTDLIAGGLARQTPVAIIRWGTRAQQHTVLGQVDTIVKIAQQANMTAPAVIVVGGVVCAREKLAWYEKHVFMGYRIVILADTVQEAFALAQELEEQKAEVITLSLEQVAVINVAQIDKVIDGLFTIATGSGIYFRSKLAINGFFDRLKIRKIDVRTLVSVAFYVCNQRLADHLESLGFFASGIGTQVPDDQGKVVWFIERDLCNKNVEHANHQTPSNTVFIPFTLDLTSTRIIAMQRGLYGNHVDVVWYTSASQPLVDAVLAQTDHHRNSLLLNIDDAKNVEKPSRVD